MRGPGMIRQCIRRGESRKKSRQLDPVGFNDTTGLHRNLRFFGRAILVAQSSRCPRRPSRRLLGCLASLGFPLSLASLTLWRRRHWQSPKPARDTFENECLQSPVFNRWVSPIALPLSRLPRIGTPRGPRFDCTYCPLAHVRAKARLGGYTIELKPASFSRVMPST
jgi:hypothetical protein